MKRELSERIKKDFIYFNNKMKKIEDILNNDSRDVLQQGKYTKDEIREMIVHLEKYINHNLNMNLKFEFFI